jgi:hypothetical protein
MKVLIAVLAAAAVGAAAVLFGLYLPERGRRFDLESHLALAEADLAAARSLLRIHALYDRVLDLLEDSRDPASFEKAQAASTPFFDRVRDEASGTSSPAVQAALKGVLARRDAVTGALARRDPAVRATLDEIRRGLHPLLAQPGSEAAAVAPAPAAR